MSKQPGRGMHMGFAAWDPLVQLEHCANKKKRAKKFRVCKGDDNTDAKQKKFRGKNDSLRFELPKKRKE